MCRSFDQILSAILCFRLAGGLEARFLAESKPVPGANAETHVEREAELGFLNDIVHRLHLMHEIIIQSADIFFRQLAIVLIWHCWIKMRAVGTNAIIESGAKLIECPVSNAGFLIRSDVGRPDRTHRACNRAATGKGLAAFHRMAGHAVGGIHDIFALPFGRLPVCGQFLGRFSQLYRHEDEGQQCDNTDDDQSADYAKKSFHHHSPQISGRGLDRYCVRIACAVE